MSEMAEVGMENEEENCFSVAFSTWHVCSGTKPVKSKNNQKMTSKWELIKIKSLRSSLFSLP